MSQATRAGQLTLGDYLDRAWREGAMWTLICAALYLVLALASYSPSDPGWSFVGDGEQVTNVGGRIGAWFADLALFLFGVFAYLLPLMVSWSAYLVFRQRAPEPETKLYWLALRWVGFVLLLTSGAALATIYGGHLLADLPNGIGGGLGLLINQYTQLAFGPAGAPLALVALFLVGFMLATGVSLLQIVDGLGALTLGVLRAPVVVLRTLGRLRLPALPRLGQRPADREHEAFDDDLDAASEADADAVVPPLRAARPQFDDIDDDDDPRDLAPEVLTDVARFAAATTAVPRAGQAPATPGSEREAARPPVARKRAQPTADKRQLPLPKLAGGPGDRPPLELLDPPKKSARAVSREQ